MCPSAWASAGCSTSSPGAFRAPPNGCSAGRFRRALEPGRLRRRYLLAAPRALARAVAYAARGRAPAPIPSAQTTLAPAAPPHPRLTEAPDWRLAGREAAVAPVQTSAGQDA